MQGDREYTGRTGGGAVVRTGIHLPRRGKVDGGGGGRGGRGWGGGVTEGGKVRLPIQGTGREYKWQI